MTDKRQQTQQHNNKHKIHQTEERDKRETNTQRPDGTNIQHKQMTRNKQRKTKDAREQIKQRHNTKQKKTKGNRG